jgi:hypothetical protein
MSNSTDSLDWQQDFIATNALVLGYNAWMGYLGGERGALVCSTNSPVTSIARETFKIYFVPRRRMAAFLNAWLAGPDTVLLRQHTMNAHILEAVDTYDPTTGTVLLLETFNQGTFFYLPKLPIAPPDCYEQVCKSWEEFQPQSIEASEAQLRHR